MNRLRDAFVAAGVGIAAHFFLQSTNSGVAEEDRQHNAAVEKCAEYLGGVARQASELPKACEPFAYELTNPYSMWPGPETVAAGKAKPYILPASQKFLNAELDTPKDIAADVQAEQNSNTMGSVIIFGMSFAGQRYMRWYKKDKAGQQAPLKPRPSGPPPVGQLNEDSPEWLKYVQKKGL
jgi:hypothetical protein